MRKSKFSETQIVGILKDAEGGIPVADLLRIRSDGNLYQRGSTRVGLSPALFKSGTRRPPVALMVSGDDR